MSTLDNLRKLRDEYTAPSADGRVRSGPYIDLLDYTIALAEAAENCMTGDTEQHPHYYLRAALDAKIEGLGDA